ncbi:hypothetical protein GSI_05388 [Ganoderma sinense ZZ0214-1]|uniref:Uncharacterized protein n=1 Tax=Ganoderma sinense ZZ0214-1 TaxID=1077348 RepID=A0A2G8SG01_9APHY|nr:hypothetical protein GSI_05388 [Ganoderma sinense ZZ0214-1]
MEVLAWDAIQLVMNGPSSEVRIYGRPFRSDDPNWTYFDDALTELEEDLICGMYLVQTTTYQKGFMVSNTKRLGIRKSVARTMEHQS